MKTPTPHNAATILRTKREEISALVETVKADAQTIRTKISQLRTRREKLMTSPMSKSEFLRLACGWVDKQANEGAQRLARSFTGGDSLRNGGATLERTRQGDGVKIPGILTNGQYGMATVMTDEAAYLFLREGIKQALTGPVAELIKWPYTDTIDDVDAALAEVEAIDNELEQLGAELAGLVELGESYGATI